MIAIIHFSLDNVDRKLLKNSDDLRTHFRGHRWVYIRKDQSNSVDSFDVVDACAGPVAEPISLESYLNRVIDLGPTKHKYTDYTPNEGPLNFLDCPSVVELSLEPVLTKASALNFDSEWDNGHLDVLPILKDLQNMTKQEQRSPKSLPVSVPVEDIFSRFRSTIYELHQGKAELFTSKYQPPSFGTHGTHVAWDIYKKDIPKTRSWASLLVDVCQSFDAAALLLADRIASLDEDPHHALESPSGQKPKAGAFHFTGKGRNNFKMIVYGNVVTGLNDCAPEDEIELLALKINDLIETYQSTGLKHVRTDSNEVTYPQKCRVNENFYVNISVSIGKTSRRSLKLLGNLS